MAKFTTVNLKGEYFGEGIMIFVLSPNEMPHNCKGGVNVDTNNIIESMKAVTRQFCNSDELKLKYFILSFKQNEVDDPYVADAIAKDIMDYLGKEYQAIYGVHESGVIYINIAMNSVSYIDGHQFTDEKTEYDSLYSELHSILGKYNIKGLASYLSEADGDREKCRCSVIFD